MSKKIIIIEDDPDILDVMSCILANEGYEVISSVDPKPLDDVQVIQPMLILMDNRLKGTFGADFCRQFKTDPATSNYPVAIVSATPSLDRVAADSLADDFLPKPFDIEELVALVKKYE